MSPPQNVVSTTAELLAACKEPVVGISLSEEKLSTCPPSVWRPGQSQAGTETVR